ncbi:MAG: ion channel [Rikenellaceae bacterium]
MSWRKFFDYLVVVSSVVLMVAISIEILDGDEQHFTPWYIHLQLAICLIFIADFFVAMASERNKWRYFYTHFIVLLISLPYLSLHSADGGAQREELLLIALMPILRAFVAIYILLRWVIRGESARRILYAYVLSVTSFTYVSALLFYDCEMHVNDSVNSFGDALWWASMALTTTEISFVPVTTTARVLSVALPLAGMLMLPVATNFLFSIRRSE